MEAYVASVQFEPQATIDAITQVLAADPDLVILGHSLDSFAGGVASVLLNNLRRRCRFTAEDGHLWHLR
jgi:hypothetical protein